MNLNTAQANQTYDFNNKTPEEMYKLIETGTMRWTDLSKENRDHFLTSLYKYYEQKNPELKSTIQKVATNMSLKNGILNVVVVDGTHPENDVIAALIKAIDKEAIIIYKPANLKPNQAQKYIENELESSLKNNNSNIKSVNISFVHGTERNSRPKLLQAYKIDSCDDLPNEAKQACFKFNPDVETIMGGFSPEKYADMIWSIAKIIETRIGKTEINFNSPACGVFYRDLYYKINQSTQKVEPISNSDEVMGDKVLKRFKQNDETNPIKSKFSASFCTTECFNKSIPNIIELVKHNPNTNDIGNILYFGFNNGGYLGILKRDYMNPDNFGTVPIEAIKGYIDGTRPLEFREEIYDCVKKDVIDAKKTGRMKVDANNSVNSVFTNTPLKLIDEKTENKKVSSMRWSRSFSPPPSTLEQQMQPMDHVAKEVVKKSLTDDVEDLSNPINKLFSEKQQKAPRR